jgi:hypothetical protein
MRITKTINTLFLVFYLFWAVPECNARGEKPVSQFHAGIFYGSRSISCDSFPMNNHLDYDFLHMQKCTLGLQIQTSLLVQDKYINYRNTVFKWTNQQPEKETILSSKHNFLKYEIDAGIAVLW